MLNTDKIAHGDRTSCWGQMPGGSVPRRASVTIDPVALSGRVAKFYSRSLKGESKVSAIRLALSQMDLTTLEGTDTPDRVRQLCRKAASLCSHYPDVPKVAAVCVFPNLVATAREALDGTGIRVASVATGFPHGQIPLDLKLAEVSFAVSEGADEIDMVISRGAFLRGDYNQVFDEIAEVKEVCGTAHLKVILETGELGTLDRVRHASEIAMAAGADFIKTSTGKIPKAAEPMVVATMLYAIRDYFLASGKKIGMKPAGGIRTTKQALPILVMVKEILGKDWLSPDLFRFGASSLANDLLKQLVKQETGSGYQRYFYYSVD